MFGRYLLYDKSPVFFRDCRVCSAIQAVWVMMSQNYEYEYCRLLNITSAFVPLWKQRSNWLLGSRVGPLLIVAEFRGHRGNSLGEWRYGSIHSYPRQWMEMTQSASLPGRLNPPCVKRSPGAHWIEPRNWSDRFGEKKKMFCHSRESNHNSSVV